MHVLSILAVLLSSITSLAQVSSGKSYFVLKPSKCTIGETKFFDNKDLKGEPAYVLNQDGLFQGKKKVCAWPKPCVKDSTLVDCPGTAPIDQPKERRLASIEVESNVVDSVYETKAAGVSFYFKSPNSDEFKLKDSPKVQLEKKAKAAEDYLKDNKGLLEWRDKLVECLDNGDKKCVKKYFDHSNMRGGDGFENACEYDTYEKKTICEIKPLKILKTCLEFNPKNAKKFNDQAYYQQWDSIICDIKKANGSWKIFSIEPGDYELQFYPDEDGLPINETHEPFIYEDIRGDEG